MEEDFKVKDIAGLISSILFLAVILIPYGLYRLFQKIGNITIIRGKK